MKRQVNVGIYGNFVGKKCDAALYIPITPNEFDTRSQRSSRHCLLLTVVFCLALTLGSVLSGAFHLSRPAPSLADPFYSSIVTPHDVCEGVTGRAVSHSGFIGLKGDSDETPKRSFFWSMSVASD